MTSTARKTWRRIVETDEADLSRVSFIIPALNEAAHVAATLQSVRAGRPHEIIAWTAAARTTRATSR